MKILEFTPINFELRSAEEQEFIISQFAGVLRTMPKTVQFKIVTKKADTNKYVKRIWEDIEEETVETCRVLDKKQIDLIIQLSSNQAVSRRFFVIFEHESDVGFKRRPSFEQIKLDLEREARGIISALHVCGNVVLSEKGDAAENDEYIISLLFSIMSRGESEFRSFNDRVTDVIARYSSQFASTDTFIVPVNDFIAPSIIDAKASPRYMIVDDTYYMFCYIPASAYPVTARAGWLSTFINIGAGVDVDFFFHKENIADISRKLHFKLRANKVKMRETEDTSQDFEDLNAAIESGYYLKSSIAGNEDFCYFAVMLTITAHTLEELNYKYDVIRRHLIKQTMSLKPCLFQQLDAFTASLPLCKPNPTIWKKSKRNIVTSSLASAYPFVSYEMADENGIFLGVNQNNGSLVFIDNFDTSQYTNANMVILGSTGSGKTYTLLTMAMRMRKKGIQVFIIAPEKGHEFRRACAAMGGTFIDITPGSESNINIMEIRQTPVPEDKEDQIGVNNTSALMVKIQRLHEFFSLLIRDISFDEVQILDEALIETYKRFGISADNASLLNPDNPLEYKTMPILGDLQETLFKMGHKARRLANSLNRFVTGSAKSFNQHTNVDLTNKFVVLNVTQLTNELKPVGMYIAIDYVWDITRQDVTQQKAILMDETWKLIGESSSVEAAEFIIEIFRLIRGYGGCAVAASQNVMDFFSLDDGKYGSAIINSAKIKLLLKVEPMESEALAKVMRLTEAERKELTVVEKGGLLMANSNNLFIRVYTSDTEHDLITTSAKDIARIEKTGVRW